MSVNKTIRIRLGAGIHQLLPVCHWRALLARIIFFPVLVSLASSFASPRLRAGKPETVGMNPDILSEIDTVVRDSIQKGRIPGCVLLIARKGVIVWEKAYGYRSLRPDKVQNSPSTVYDLASLTKPIATATAIALLIEDGKLALHDRVAGYLPCSFMAS